MLVPGLIFVLLLNSFVFLSGALMMTRAARRDTERRVDLVANTPNAPWRMSHNSPIIQAAGVMLGNFFMTGMRYRWGVRAAPFLVLGIAIASFIGTWLIVHLLLRFSPWITTPVALIAGFAIPHLLLRMEQTAADRIFLDRFPNAMDMIVRMLRAGMPVSATMRLVAREAGAPVNDAFKTIADRIDIGIPFEETLAIASEQIGLSDFRFFSAAVALQRKTGGNLATTLETMCDIIRKRRIVRLKARAATAEVRLTANLLAALPFVIVGALLLVSPSYLSPLISDPRGKVIVAIALLMQIFAIVTMREMMHRAARF